MPVRRKGAQVPDAGHEQRNLTQFHGSRTWWTKPSLLAAFTIGTPSDCRIFALTSAQPNVACARPPRAGVATADLFSAGHPGRTDRQVIDVDVLFDRDS